LKVAALKITAQPANRFSLAGKTATFTVKATGTGLKYQWQYRTSSKGKWTDTATGNKPASLKVPVTAARNGYQYRCKITDKYANTIYTKAATLKIVTLKITRQPKDVVIAENTTSLFSVAAKGTGLRYQWQYRASSNDKWTDATDIGNKTNGLRITAKFSRYAYEYRCKITDKYGNVVYSKAAQLFVL